MNCLLCHYLEYYIYKVRIIYKIHFSFKVIHFLPLFFIWGEFLNYVLLHPLLILMTSLRALINQILYRIGFAL